MVLLQRLDHERATEQRHVIAWMVDKRDSLIVLLSLAAGQWYVDSLFGGRHRYNPVCGHLLAFRSRFGTAHRRFKYAKTLITQSLLIPQHRGTRICKKVWLAGRHG